MLAARDLGPAARSFAPAEFPYGPNTAVRRDALALVSFDERLGRKGTGQVRGSETSLFWRLQQQAVLGVWVPRAEVQHYVPRARATLRYLWAYFHGSGRMTVRLEDTCGMRPQPSQPLARIVLRTLAEFSRQPSNWPTHVARLAWAQGRRAESRQRRHTASSGRRECGSGST